MHGFTSERLSPFLVGVSVFLSLWILVDVPIFRLSTPSWQQLLRHTAAQQRDAVLNGTDSSEWMVGCNSMFKSEATLTTDSAY